MIFDSIAIAIQKFILTIHLVAGFAIAKCDAADVAYGSWPCKNSNARCARRNILEKLRVLRIDDSSDMRMDAVLENCIFYIYSKRSRNYIPRAAVVLWAKPRETAHDLSRRSEYQSPRQGR